MPVHPLNLDIFGRRRQQWNGAMTADSIGILFGNIVTVGLLVQKVQFAYTQPLNIIYEIAPANVLNGPVMVYYHAGRQEGEGAMARIIGPARLTQTFYRGVGNPCNPQNVLLHIRGGCNTGAFVGHLTFVIHAMVLFNTMIEGSAREGLYSEQLRFRFLSVNFLTESEEQELSNLIENSTYWQNFTGPPPSLSDLLAGVRFS